MMLPYWCSTFSNMAGYPLSDHANMLDPHMKKCQIIIGYYSKNQFKGYRSLQTYNQLVSGFVSSIKG